MRTRVSAWRAVVGGPAGRGVSVGANDSSQSRADTILVAESDRAVGDLVCGTLERAGYEVLRAVDGDQARALFQAHRDRIAMVLLDAAIPKAKRQALFDAVTTARPNLPILFSTGYAHHPLSGDEAAQHYPVIMKPYLPSDLVRRVREVIDRARGDDASFEVTRTPSAIPGVNSSYRSGSRQQALPRPRSSRTRETPRATRRAEC